jgi:peptidoglycan-associated lipoprotein
MEIFMKTQALAILSATSLSLFTVACAKEADTAPKAGATNTAQEDADAARKRREDEEARARAAALAAKQAEMNNLNFDFSPIHFAYDSTDLDAEGRATLEKAAQFLEGKKQVRLQIAGHADERGTAEYNLALGENRAKTVKKYLSQLGVDDKRIGTISFGELEPLDGSKTESAFAKNRRAELKQQ